MSLLGGTAAVAAIFFLVVLQYHNARFQHFDHCMLPIIQTELKLQLFLQNLYDQPFVHLGKAICRYLPYLQKT